MKLEELTKVDEFLRISRSRVLNELPIKIRTLEFDGKKLNRIES